MWSRSQNSRSFSVKRQSEKKLRRLIWRRRRDETTPHTSILFTNVFITLSISALGLIFLLYSSYSRSRYLCTVDLPFFLSVCFLRKLWLLIGRRNEKEKKWECTDIEIQRHVVRSILAFLDCFSRGTSNHRLIKVNTSLIHTCLFC